jgi:hypothetical protein
MLWYSFNVRYQIVIFRAREKTLSKYLAERNKTMSKMTIWAKIQYLYLSGKHYSLPTLRGKPPIVQSPNNK